MDKTASSMCEYQTAVIAEGWSYSLFLTRTVRQYEAPSSFARRWTFQNGPFGTIVIETPRAPDPTSFARALAAEIAKASARSGLGDGA
jgi:hypothetical protein